MEEEDFDAVLNALLRTQAVLLETGSALCLTNPSSMVGRGLLFEAGAARTVAMEAIIKQQNRASPAPDTEGGG